MLQRAFAPGVGRAFFYQPEIGLASFQTLLETKDIDIGHSTDDTYFFSGFGPWPGAVHYYDLSASSERFVLTHTGGTDDCIESATYWIDESSRLWPRIEEAGLLFTERDLCGPSDFTVMNIDGVDYEVVSDSDISHLYYENEPVDGGEFIFFIALFPITAERYQSACDFALEFDITGIHEGTYQRSKFITTIWAPPTQSR